MPVGTQTRRIIISVDTKGNQEIKALADQLGNIGKSTKSLAGNMLALKNAFVGYLGVLGVRQIASMSDEMQNLSNRLKIVSKAGEDTRDIMLKLVDLANELKQPVGDTAEVYVRLASSLKFANASSSSLLALTQVLSNSFRVSGATATETTATIIQLSQAFASGTLRGQELRSVMLQNAELARLLRERFGADLAKKAEAGLISVTEVLKILRDNMGRINEQAKLLAPTFEQTMTKAFNSFKVAVFNLNTAFSISDGFAKFVDFILKNSSNILTFFAILATAAIPRLITAVLNLSRALLVLASSNPWLLGLALLAGALVYATRSAETFGGRIDILHEKLLRMVRALTEVQLGFYKFKNAITFGSEQTNVDYYESVIAGLNDKIGSFKKGAIPNSLKADTDPLQEQIKALQELIDKYEKLSKAPDKIPKIKEVLGELNREFLTGTLTVEEYNKKFINFELYKINREFREGKFDVYAYNQKLREIDLQGLNEQLRIGTISWIEFNAAVSNNKIAELNDKFQAGRVTLSEYHQELVKISNEFLPGSALVAGTTSYLESIGTVSSNLADAIKGTFGHLEDYLFDFIKKGTFNFAQFTQAILDDLTKIIIRASIVRPLANALLSGFAGGSGANSTGGSYSDTSNVAANGAYFDKNIAKFANGGIFNSPTGFGFGQGKMGVLGEKGPEAIMPLSRGANGKLGVEASITPVNVTIINQSGNEVQKTESTGPNGEKNLEIIITSKVREGVTKGAFDSVFKNAYGISRKGS